MSRECTICGGDFDLDTEGGRVGHIGILPVAFCPTCVTGILDFAEQYQEREALFMEETNGDNVCTADH